MQPAGPLGPIKSLFATAGRPGDAFVRDVNQFSSNMFSRAVHDEARARRLAGTVPFLDTTMYSDDGLLKSKPR